MQIWKDGEEKKEEDIEERIERLKRKYKDEIEEEIERVKEIKGVEII